MGEGQLLVHGADIDDAPAAAAAFAHVPRECLGQEEHALEVHVQHQVVVGLGDVDEVGAPFHPRVVDQDVDAAELADCFGNHPPVVIHLADVTGDQHRVFAAGGLDLRERAFGAVAGKAIFHRHRGALARQPQCDRAADSLCGAGDQRNLAMQPHRHASNRMRLPSLSRRG